MSHTRKSPPLKYTTADLPTDLEVGSLVLDSTTSEHKVFNGSSWDVVEGGGAAQVETKTQTIVWEDDQGNLDQLIGDIPVDWKRLSSIKRLYIGSSCTSIGSNAFRSCTSLAGSLTIPNSVTSIGVDAFYDCALLTGDLVIPDSVTSIGDYAFGAFFSNGFNGSLVIGSGVTSIGSYAFRYCDSLTAVYTNTPASSFVGSNAFYYTTFTTIYTGPNATGYTSSFQGRTGLTISSWTNYPNVP